MPHLRHLLHHLTLAFFLASVGPLLFAPPVATGQPQEAQEVTPSRIIEEQTLNQIKALLNQQQTDQALTLLENFMEDSPNSSIFDEATFLHAVALQAKGKTKQAIIILEQFLEEYPISPFIDDARLMLGALYIETQESNRAITVLKDTLNLSQDPTTRAEAIHRLRQAHEQKGQFAQAIQSALTEIAQSREKDRGELLDYVQTLILQKMDERSLSDLLDTFTNRFPGDLALIRLIELHTAQGDEVLAERDIRAFLHRFPNHPYAQTAVALLQSFISKIKAHQHVIAAVFPFSGKMKPFGTDALNGVRLALEQGKAQLGSTTLGLVVKDSVLPPAQLRHEFSLLLDEFEPMALIGPLLAREVQKVADLADPAEVPFITPTATLPDVNKFGRFWFSTALTTPLQVKNIVAYAMQHLGYRRFCVFSPDSAYGKQLSQAFQKTVTTNGGEIIAAETYQRGTTDASAQIQRLKDKDLSLYGEMLPLELEPEKPPKEGEEQEEQLVYTPGFDALFLPGHPTDVAFLSAQLAFYDIRVPLLGSNSWNHPDLLKWGRSTIEGGIFGDALFLQSTDPEVQQFIHAYRKRFRADPSIFAAQAYDAMRVVIDGIKQGATTGPELREQLFIRHDLPTLGGRASFGQGGVLDRKVHLIQITNGRFIQIN